MPKKYYSLAELKRDATSGGMSLELISRYGKTGEEIPEKMRGIRKILGANSVALKLLNNDGKESELRLVSANLVEYDKETLTIYETGVRDVTEEEQKVLDEWAKKQKEYEERQPWSDLFWVKKDFFNKSPYPYMSGHDTVRGIKYLYNGKVRDNKVKGEKILEYKVHLTENFL